MDDKKLIDDIGTYLKDKGEGLATPEQMTKPPQKPENMQIKPYVGTSEERKIYEDIRKGVSTPSKTKKLKSGGSVSSASSRADGIAQRGKTKGRMC